MDPWPWVTWKLSQFPGDGVDLPVWVFGVLDWGFCPDLPRSRAGTRDPGAGPALRLAVFAQGPLFPQLPRWGFGECSQEGLGLHGRGGSDL